ncbi:MAG: hypothetical protein PHG29_04665 [Prolixibacteraceae bacterium]|nr:hypothetical protein [Prolixibacteraceae bacterium]
MDKVLNPQAATSVHYPLPSDKASDYNNSSIGLYPLPSVSTDGSLVSTDGSLVSTDGSFSLPFN